MANEFETLSGQVEFQSSGQGALDNTAPTFAGVASVTPNDDGSITAGWALATSSKPPVDYHVYIALGVVSAAALFIDANVTLHVPPGKTSGKIFLMPDQTTYLVKGQQYTIGVRANDAFGYTDTNMVVMQATAIASGNLPAVFQYLADAFETNNDDLATSIDALEIVASSIAAGGGTQLSAEIPETTMTIETESII